MNRDAMQRVVSRWRRLPPFLRKMLAKPGLERGDWVWLWPKP
jgi:hypothetical protein